MKTSLVLSVCVAAIVRAQGPLTPPGAPGSTMKSLAQVEPRFPVGSAPVTLSRSGSYYLTTNLSDTVTVSADNVTLDLMGFTIAPPAGSLAVTVSSGGKNLHICHGGVRLTGTDSSGIVATGVSGNLNGRIEAIRVSGGGRYGISVGDGCTVMDCQVTGADTGIRVSGNSVVRACRFEGNTTGMRLTGTGAFVEENVVRGNTNNYNIVAGNRLSLLLCEVPETLAWPCSVKFAGTLTCLKTGVHGITVSADDVTIDLCGHALVGPGAGSGHGICQNAGTRNLRVSGGTVNYWCDQSGIFLAGTGGSVSDLQAATNGIGFYANTDAVFSRCAARGNIGYGFYANERCVFVQCVAVYNDNDGLVASQSSVVTDCLAADNYGYGIATYGNSTLSGCTSRHNLRGIVGDGDNISIQGCCASDNADCGILNQVGGVIADCVCKGNGGPGILTGGGTLVSRCVASDNTEGICVGPNCRVVECASSGNSNYGIITGERGSSIISSTANNNVNTGIYMGPGATVSECTTAGNTASGITVDIGGRVSGCEVWGNSGDGIQASEGSLVSECAVTRNAGRGIVTGRDSAVAGCTVTSNGTGIAVEDACKVSSCTAQRNRGVGILAWSGGSILDCASEYNVSNGVEVTGNAFVARCVANNNGNGGNGTGFLLKGMGNRIEGNQALGNDKGFQAYQGGNFIARNTSRWNSPNWSIVSGNICLVVVGTSGGAISGDSGGAAPGSTDPNANFTY